MATVIKSSIEEQRSFPKKGCGIQNINPPGGVRWGGGGQIRAGINAKREKSRSVRGKSPERGKKHSFGGGQERT